MKNIKIDGISFSEKHLSLSRKEFMIMFNGWRKESQLSEIYEIGAKIISKKNKKSKSNELQLQEEDNEN